MVTGMQRLLFLALLLVCAPASAASLGVVNGTGEPVASTSIRPSGVKADWQPLAGGQAQGARVTVDVSTDAQCAFDIRVRLSSRKELVYSRVNLCETSGVALNQRADGTTWVDYA